MNQEMLDAIKKVLPSIQIETLNEELAKAKQLPAEQEKVKQHQADSANLREQVRKHEAEISRLNGLVKTQAELDKIKNDFEIQKLTYQLQAEKEKHSAVKELVSAVFRNPTYIKDTQVPVAYNNNGMSGFTVPVTETTTVR